ncbi:LamG domain-containing protein [Planktothricoides raciborskii]|uniref:LamG domain-containing protein n=2 Tax=Planktothricoides raciborskii TaxID=132608 RepID=A0AAU8JFR2_9CYAN|nr:LamG domain-containing protein [Planktothricoides raciborskii]MBD2545212.1 LamG domain-containing protein [Planktothricoides raciborskii FACHB-1370]MBD2583259.1 LamG domain-containing protein [Planktothricoides raciborskii FACHB-1261]
MYLTKEKLQHINTIAHEGKVVIVATDADGKIWYSVKQDGFEDSYLNTPADQRTGWEKWQELEFPNEDDDQSVIDQETAELTDGNNPNSFVLRSCYKTFDQTAVAPVQLISALGHIYVFRQSKTNTLLVDRFVLDGMTNKLNRKLEVRFKRSRQKHEASKNMKKGASGLTNIDTLDFRDANGNFFYEPTTELCLINNLQKGWFSVVLVPTIENDVYRWHIFAYNSQTQKVELTTMRVSDEGLFDVQDYTIFEESNDNLIPRSIAGIIKRTLDLGNVSVVNGLTATKYDVQREKQTDDGMQLLRESTKVMLAIPTSNGNVAAFSFAIAGDGILSQISENPTSKIWRNTIRQILLPLNTLDNVKAIGTTNPPPQGQITALQQGEDDGVNVVSSTDTNLETTNQVKISGTQNYNIFQQSITKIDDDSFEIASPTTGLGNWEVIPEQESGLVFNGMITAYEITDTGNIKITAKNHGLNDGESLQILDTRDYNGTYTVKKIDDKTFTLDDIKWQAGTAVNLKLESQKRRGLVFDGVNDYVDCGSGILADSYTKEAWIKWESGAPYNNIISGYSSHAFYLPNGILSAGHNGNWSYVQDTVPLTANTWIHVALTYDSSTQTMKLYKNGQLIKSATSVPLVSTTDRNIFIGAFANPPSSFFKGSIADVRLWKVARTEEQIRNSMYLQLTGKELGLVGYWRLGAVAEEGKERKVIDFSVNGNDGVVYGGAYVSAATLSRNLPGTTTPAIKYENEELFAVSENATYEEEFEFKVNPAVDPNNVDGQGGKIFQIIYKGKNNRSAIDWLNIPANATEFTNLGGGWYKAKCRFNVPDGVSLVRSFGIGNIKGSWTNLEIRKQLICLVSDSITEAKYTDTVNLATLADNHAQLAVALKQIELKEPQEALLLIEKRKLELEIASLSLSDTDKQAAITAKNTEISKQQTIINNLQTEVTQCQTTYEAEKQSPLNYWCKLVCRVNEGWIARIYTQTSELLYADVGANGNPYYSNNYFKFVATGNGYYQIVSMYENRALYGGLKTQVYSTNGGGFFEWKPQKISGDYYLILHQSGGALDRGGGDYGVCIWDLHTGVNQQWKIIPIGGESNSNISNAYSAWNSKQSELASAKQLLTKLQNELSLLQLASGDQSAKKAALLSRLDVVKAEIVTIQTELNTLNTNFINGVKSTQLPPQAMPQIAKDDKGLITQGAWLGFVNPASRLNAIETCEGNVQLSYFDSQGRMRLTNYDATSDSSNTAFEQWLPDAQRACLNFSNANSVVKLSQQVYLSTDWSIEAWFCYPLPETAQWNTLIRGQNADHNIIVSRDQKLGIYLTNDPLTQYFYDCGFNMESLSTGWHHLTAVGEGDTTRFYIDGKQVGDIKAKAVKDAEASLNLNPTDAAAKQKVEDIKKANLKVSNDVYAIGNNHLAANKPVDYGVMKFDGVNDCITVTDNPNLQISTYSVEVWIKPENPVADWQGIIGKPGRNFNIWLNRNGFIHHRFHTPSSTNAGAPDTPNGSIVWNQWNHVAITNDGTTAKTYINGKMIAQGATGGSLIVDKTPLYMGCLDNASFCCFKGQIADARIWKVVRTEAEIQADMRKRLTGKEANLVAYYPLNKLEGGKVLDLVANNHGTVFEATNVTDQALSLTPVIQGEQFGKVVEVRIWGVALSNEEVEVNSKTLITGNESGLLAYYPMNEATGTEVRDHTGKGNQGTMTNPVWWACAAPIGSQDKPGNKVMKFDGVNDHITFPAMNINYSQGFSLEVWVRYNSLKSWSRIFDFGNGAGVENILLANKGTTNTLGFHVYRGTASLGVEVANFLELQKWMHIAVTLEPSGSCKVYKNGQLIQSGTSQLPNSVNRTLNYIGRSNWPDAYFDGQMAEFRLWNRVRTEAEIKADLNQRLTGKESGLAIYLPLDEIKFEGSTKKVFDLVGTNHGTITEAAIAQDNSSPLMVIGSSLVSAEYSTISLDPATGKKAALMRRLLASPALNGVNLLPDKRIETLELKWIGNSQFAPTLLGYIEGPPPVPSENLTLADDYNGATSVELVMSEDVEFNWTRSQDSGLGATAETFIGAGGAMSVMAAPLGIGASIETSAKVGFKGNLDFTYQFQNESSITSSSSLSMTDKLELRGTPEADPKFPHLGNRFIPKNIGYALVVSAIADVFVTRLARSKKMVGYQVQPVDSIPPDVNTITFLMNPAYTMNGSLDGMTGSSATSDRFFKHVPEMRSQYGSLYPASYYRLQEAYELKRQIEKQDQQRQSYFNNFNVRMIDEMSLDRNIESGDVPTTIGVQREEDKPSTEMTAEEQAASEQDKAKQFEAETEEASKKTNAATKAKQAEIQSKITDQEKQIHAVESFAGWQKRMEDIQIKAGKRNIVNTYVWDADGGLRTEAQSFANTVEHTIGGSFSLSAGLGVETEFAVGGVDVELTAQATVNMTQTMSKTETRSKGLELNIDLSGMENKGVTDYKDNPILPGEKVDRYRFMSFYLEASTQHFQDFFNYVVDPEWLQSNDEEARALRQTQAGKPNKTWRVLHRVTYVERPALMGFGRDVRQFKVQDENVGIGKVIVDVATLQQKVDQILEWISSQPK